MGSYKIWSSDSHILEPGDLWEKRIDKGFKDKAPRIVREGDLDQWYCEDVPFGAIGVNQQAGLRFEDSENLTLLGAMETVPLGGVDPDAHVKDMDLDGVEGGVLYPSQALTVWQVPASDLFSAICRAYNDYLADFCSGRPHPNRLTGIAMVNVDSVEDAVGEMQRVAKMGMPGAMIAVRPLLRYNEAAYDNLWACAQDLDMPISLHTGTFRWRPGMASTFHVDYSNRDFDVRQCLSDMIMSGVFERYPRLMVGAIEFEISWAPFFMTSMDFLYKDTWLGRQVGRFTTDMLPSDFFRRNVFLGFQEDELGIALRHHVGVDNLLWGSDYPHAESTFPRSQQILEEIFHDVSEDEKSKIAGENTAKLYHFV